MLVNNDTYQTETLSERPIRQPLNTPMTSCMFLKPIVEEEIIKIIYKFNQNKSAGNDGIGNFIVKRIAKEISVPLTQIFNTSISTGIVPDELKIAKVIPIYKKR